ncbi:MAG TPA: TaqI-like C-terminal specificity domain-containing protein [Pirellulales bacterium]|nr:TaqI-like C-terminal specificity domain-containing protein [Pirellulales bacterium]
MLNNIYGVDIDSQAVEVTKLSLLLKVLEHENRETLERQLRLLHVRALPDLAGNIKCGNSLIGPDFYDARQMTLLDEEEQYRINAFDWRAEFPEVFGGKGKEGGFDAVIGNPPYVRMEEFKELKDYFRERYSTHDERSDLYVYFIEREHELLRPDGAFGMIVSNKFVRANYGRKVRELLANVARIDRIVDLAGLPVFKGATVRTIVLLTSKGGGTGTLSYSPPITREQLAGVESGALTLERAVDPVAYDVAGSALAPDGWNLSRAEHSELLAKLKRIGKPLVEVVDGKICMGIKSGLTDAFAISAEEREAIVAKNPEADEILHPFLQGRDIRPYFVMPRDEFLIYTYHGIDMKAYPAILEHLRPFKQRLQDRATKQPWYELQQPQLAYREMMQHPKIVFPDIATTCRFALDTRGRFGANTVYFLPTDHLLLLGILNSRLAHFYFAQTCAALEGSGDAYLRFFGQYMEGFPVAAPSPSDKATAGRIVELVETRTSLASQQVRSRNPDEKTRVQRQIETADRQIDQLVCELYGLTDEETALMEEEREQR